MITSIQAASDLFNSSGYFYITDGSGTFPAPGADQFNYGIPTFGFQNIPVNRGILEAFMRDYNPVSGERYAFTIVEITAAVADNCTTFNINGVAQIGGAVAMTAGNLTQSATDIAAAINAYTAGAGIDYRAVSSGAFIYVVANTAGTGPNGHAVSVLFSGASAATFDTVNGGDSPGNSRYRIYLDANYSATPTATALAAEAVDITDAISFRGLNHPVPVVSAVCNTNAIVVDRIASKMEIRVQGGTTTDCQVIQVNGAIPGDEIVITGESVGTSVTFKSIVGGTDNISLDNDSDFIAVDSTTRLSLEYTDDSFTGWGEVARSNSLRINRMRELGIGEIPATPGIDNYTVLAAGGTLTLFPGRLTAPGANESNNNDVLLNGSPTLVANFAVAVNITDALDGDNGEISGKGSSIALNGNTMTVGTCGINEALAASGQWHVYWKTNGAAIEYLLEPDFDDSHTNWLDGDQLLDGSVDAQKLDAASRTSTVTIPVSFETNELGNHKVNLPPCTVTEVHAAVVKLIEATDDATITFVIGGVAVGAFNITLPAGSAIGTVVSSFGTGTAIPAAPLIESTTAKATPGGKAILSVTIQLT